MDAHDSIASAPSTVPPPPPPPPPLPPAAVIPWRRPVLGFAFDFVLANVLVLVAGIVGFAAWVVVRGAQLGLLREPASDPAQLMARIGQPGGLALAGIAIASTAPVALFLYFWRRSASAAERAASQRALRRARTWGWALLAGTAAFAFTVLVTALGQHGGIEQAPSNLPVIEAVGGPHPLLLLLFAVVLAPAYEELLFRRVLFGRLWAAGRPWLGLILSSLAFALMHELPGLTGNDWPATLLLWACYAAMGAAFAWAYWRTGTLWAAIVAHASTNLLGCTLYLAGAG